MSSPSLRESLRIRHEASATTLVVIDDDPTGCQTVGNVPLLLTWDVPSLAAELSERPPLLYILTNSRSVPAVTAHDLNCQVAGNLLAASRQTGRAFSVISRSDSTLRGHFKPELDALAEVLGPYDGIIVIPYFGEGDRHTINDVHYLRSGQQWLPVGQSPFAQDPAFGYTASNLREWVAEKSGGRWAVEDVGAISLHDIRRGGLETVTQKLMRLPHGKPVIVNAASDHDIEVVAAALMQTEAQGRRWLPRTAASFVKIRAGRPDLPLLIRADLNLAQTSSGGLVIAGSFVPQTTAQLKCLLARPNVVGLELDVNAVNDPSQTGAAVENAIKTCTQIMASGQTAVLYTARTQPPADPQAALAIGQRIMQALCSIVQGLPQPPAFIVAKGGITSHQIAHTALNCQKALVLGQIAPGVPVWRLDRAARFSHLPYIVFPGNVGGDDTLANVVAALQ